jgi:hypothetical protein
MSEQSDRIQSHNSNNLTQHSNKAESDDLLHDSLKDAWQPIQMIQKDDQVRERRYKIWKGRSHQTPL